MILHQLIKEIQPDLIVKGGDYTVEEIVGHDLAPVYIVPTVEGHSTSRIINENINYRSKGFIGQNLCHSEFKHEVASDMISTKTCPYSRL